MRCDSLIDERLLDEAIDRYVAWREECYVVQDAYDRWSCSSGPDAARAFMEYQAALDREGQIASVYRNLMARVVVTPAGEHGLGWYAVEWARALVIPAVVTALVLAIAVGTGAI